MVEGEQIVFSLPGSVAPWKQQAALDETTQTDVEKVKVKEQRSGRVADIDPIPVLYNVVKHVSL